MKKDQVVCQCTGLGSKLSTYLNDQVNNVETLIVARGYLQSATGQNEALFRRLNSYIARKFELDEPTLKQVIQFQIDHMSLWLAGISELNEIARTRGSKKVSPNWYAYDNALFNLLIQTGSDSSECRRVISEINTEKVKIWASIQEPKIDPAFLMLASRDLENQLKIIANALECEESNDFSASTKEPFGNKRGGERSPFLDKLAFLEERLGFRDEFLKSRTNLGLQMRHVHAHGDGRFDALAVNRLSEPFVGVFHEGLRIPLGTQTHDLGAEFFIDVYTALVVTLYRDLFLALHLEETCEARYSLAPLGDLIALQVPLPRTWKVACE